MAFSLILFFLAITEAAFTIKDSQFGSGDAICNVKTLQNTDTGELVSIITNYGGTVDQLVLRTSSTGKLRDVIQWSNGNCQFIVDNSDYQGKMLLPYANRIANGTYIWNGTRLYLPINEPARNNSIHGLIYLQPLTVVEQKTGATGASLTLGYVFNPSVYAQQGYPFPLTVYLNYTLSTQGFDVNVTGYNADAHWSLPFYNAWHPYFLCDVPSSIVQFDTCTRWNHVDVFNDSNLYSNLIPTGRTTLSTTFDGTTPIGGTTSEPTYYDDEYKPLVRCGSAGKERSGFLPAFHHRIIDKSSSTTIVLWAEAEKYPFVQIFTGAQVNFGFSAIALEPMSAECDAYNNFDSLRILSGGETWSGTFGVYLE